MLEMRQTGVGVVTLWNDGAEAGGAAWAERELAWGRERVKVARLTRFDALPGDVQPLRAYLDFLWQSGGVAAVRELDGGLTWFHQALKQSWEAAGRPEET